MLSFSVRNPGLPLPMGEGWGEGPFMSEAFTPVHEAEGWPGARARCWAVTMRASNGRALSAWVT